MLGEADNSRSEHANAQGASPTTAAKTSAAAGADSERERFMEAWRLKRGEHAREWNLRTGLPANRAEAAKEHRDDLSPLDAIFVWIRAHWAFFRFHISFALKLYSAALSIEKPRAILKVARKAAIGAMIAAPCCAVLASAKVDSSNAFWGITDIDNVHPIAAFLIILIHLAYWHLLTQDQIFTKQIGRLRLRNVLFPLGLLLIYIFSAVTTPSQKIWVVVGFMVLYFLWLLDEYAEIHFHRSLNRPPGEILRSSTWMLIDLLLVACLLYAIIDYIFLDESIRGPAIITRVYGHFFGIKEAIILANLYGYLVAFHISRATVHSHKNLYYAQMSDYIRTRTDLTSDVRDLPNVLRQYLGDESGAAEQMRVLDFACAGGIRSLSLLRKIVLREHRAIEVVGYDQDPSWAKRWNANATANYFLSDVHFTADPADLSGLFAHCNVIVASHVFSDSEIVRTIRKMMLESKRDRWLMLIAGPDLNHFVSSIMHESSLQGIEPTEYYRWRGRNMRKFFGKKNDRATWEHAMPKPFATIHRRLDVDQHSARYLTWWIEAYYGFRIAKRQQNVFERIVTDAVGTRIDSLCADDVLYVVEVWKTIDPKTSNAALMMKDWAAETWAHSDPPR